MPVNIQINDPNFSLGPLSGFFYTASNSLQSLLQIEADSTVVNSFPVARSSFRTPTKQLHFDGTFFWTLEDLPSDLGIVVKQWRLAPHQTVVVSGAVPIEFRWQDEMSLINGPTIKWSADAFAVEHYHRTLASSFLQGVNTIRLNSVANISPGNTLYLGPSTFTDFEGNEESIIVLSINTITNGITFGKVGGLENSYISSDPVDFSKSIFIFNNNSFSGDEDGIGTLSNFSWPDKILQFTDTGNRYGAVTAADFDGNILNWARGFQILELDLSVPNFDLTKSQEANIFEDNLIDTITIADLIADFSNTQYLKLQDKETTEDVTTGAFSTTSFGSLFNFQQLPTLPVVNSISLEFDTRFNRPFSSADTTQITARVRDQFNFPVLSETVQFSAVVSNLGDSGVPGTFSPSSAVTNVSGIVQTVYTPSTTLNPILVDITAKVL